MPVAINPYNFIPFYGDSYNEPPKRKKLEEYYPEGEELISGWLDVELIAKSELIVPDGSRYEETSGQHKSYRFFRHPDGVCAIPGSELRGALRSMYEAASNSCFTFLLEDPQKPISQRTPIYGAFKERGLLEYDKQNGCCKLWEAKAYRIRITSPAPIRDGQYHEGEQFYKTGDEVKFDLDADGKPVLGAGEHTGYLQFNIPVGKIDEGRCYNVAVLEKTGVCIAAWNSGDRSAWDSVFGSVWPTADQARKAKEKAARTGRPWIRNTTLDDLMAKINKAERDGGIIPVYYFEVERDGRKLYYFSGAAAGRVRQVRKWAEIMGEHRPCHSLDCLCPACALFGTTAGEGIKGHLRVTDARAEMPVKPARHTLQILGGPRPSSFEFYLRRPEAAEKPTYWNYDYFGVREEVQTKTGTIERTRYQDLKSATPRGRKFYWHGETMPDRNQRDRLNQTMEAMPAGTTFAFRIYFDRVNREQLNDLVWLVSLGENQTDGKYQYKLGHAKPLGYGSVKMVVKDCVTRALREDLAMSIQHMDIPACPPCSFDVGSKTIQSILRMSDSTSTEGHDVAYLTGVDNRGREQIFTWFQQNRTNPNVLRTLPEPWESDLTLPTRRGARDGSPQGQYGTGRNSGSGVSRGNAPQQPGALVGKEVEGTVRKVFPNGNTFIRLDGSRTDGFYRQRYSERIREGDVLKVRILSYDADRKNYQVRPV